jgi:hypothetical protein
MKTPPPPYLDTDPDAPPSEGELRAASELRDALSDPLLVNEDAALARALVLAHSPRALDEGDNRALMERALSAPIARVTHLGAVRARRSWSAWGVAGVSAVAVAALAIVFMGFRHGTVAWSVPPQASVPRYARSAQPLFHEPFAVRGGGSTRIDRIASARASDLRENRFARWKVQ